MRECGMLLPVASLPSRYGIGAFSKEAYDFIDTLRQRDRASGRFCPWVPPDLEIRPTSPFRPLREIHILLIWKS